MRAGPAARPTTVSGGGPDRPAGSIFGRFPWLFVRQISAPRAVVPANPPRGSLPATMSRWPRTRLALVSERNSFAGYGQLAVGQVSAKRRSDGSFVQQHRHQHDINFSAGLAARRSHRAAARFEHPVCAPRPAVRGRSQRSSLPISPILMDARAGSAENVAYSAVTRIMPFRMIGRALSAPHHRVSARCGATS